MTLVACLQAARPKTLPAAIIPVVLGCILAFYLRGEYNFYLALCTLFGAIFIQIATNFFNDAIDAAKGADTEKRLGPRRVTASGLLSSRQVYTLAIVCLCAASVFGLALTYERGWVVIIIGIPSLYLSYGYTGGPFPLAYRGMGELFVLFFFGWVATTGTVFIQTGEFLLEALLLGTQVGLLSAVLILVNNIRDREEDRCSDKRTIAVKLGGGRAVLVLWGMTISCYLLGLMWFVFKLPSLALLPLLGLFLGGWICIGVGRLVKEEGTTYNTFLGSAAVQLLLFALLWIAAWSFS